MTQQPRTTFVLRDHSEILETLAGIKDVAVLHDERRGPDVELAVEQLIRDQVHRPSPSWRDGASWILRRLLKRHETILRESFMDLVTGQLDVG